VAEIDVWLPRKLNVLREPHRYKVLYGGRGGIKSWSVAQILLYMGTQQDLRIPCARETMQSHPGERPPAPGGSNRPAWHAGRVRGAKG
jgi:hypothetical protein